MGICSVVQIRVCDTQSAETAEYRYIRIVHNTVPFWGMLGIICSTANRVAVNVSAIHMLYSKTSICQGLMLLSLLLGSVKWGWKIASKVGPYRSEQNILGCGGCGLYP